MTDALTNAYQIAGEIESFLVRAGELLEAEDPYSLQRAEELVYEARCRCQSLKDAIDEAAMETAIAEVADEAIAVVGGSVIGR